MAFDVSGLSAYVDENKNDLIAASVAGAKSAEVLPIQTGIKSSAPINIMDTDVAFQDGNPASAGRTPNGTTTYSQRPLTVAHIKVEEDFDVRDLNAYYLQHELKAGSYDDEIPVEQAWSELKARKIANTLETAIWQGEEGGAGGANLDKFDGFLRIITEETASVVHVDGSTLAGISAGDSITRSNVVALVDETIQAIPVQLLSSDDLAVFMGRDTFRLFQFGLKDANLYHVPSKMGSGIETMEYGGVTIYALDGLNGVAATGSPIVAGRISNFVLGMDLVDDRMELWYSKDDKVVKFDAEFKVGCQIAFPEEVVECSIPAI